MRFGIMTLLMIQNRGYSALNGPIPISLEEFHQPVNLAYVENFFVISSYL